MNNSPATSSASRFLIPAHTVAEADGQSAGLELGPLAGKTLLLLLRLEEVLEQESLHVSVWGSADGQDWGSQALFWYPQQFYKGIVPAAVDLRQRPEVRFLKARWETNRWGRGIPRPFFRMSLEVQETNN